MTDFLLELRSEEIPARMQVKAKDDLARLFAEEIAKAGLTATSIETFATPRRLALIARGLPHETAAVSEERKGPRSNAPEQALAGFLRSTGLTREQLVERDGVFFAVVERAGRPTTEVLSIHLPLLIWNFPWPKSMRWGAQSDRTDSLRWVRPLQSVTAIFGREVVPINFDMAHVYAFRSTDEITVVDSPTGLIAGATTVGHRFHHSGPISIESADTYVEQLHAAHVIVHLSERTTLIRDGARAAAAAEGLTLVEDEGLVVENAGLTEWPVPLLGRFDPAYLDVPREVIQLTMRTNQKYFACTDSTGALANAFVCTANIDASDGGAAIVAGNRKVLAARLSDAKFFWENDLKVPLAVQAEKLSDIVFHEKLGTVADKVERVAKLARWLVESGVVGGSNRSSATTSFPERSRGTTPSEVEVPLNANNVPVEGVLDFARTSPSTSLEKVELADLAETAARLCKADLVTGMVGEFPELQGIIGGHLARAQGLPDAVADAIRDHYKPVGQGDDVPTAPVTVAVSLADKLDTLLAYFALAEAPTGSKDPFALRRAALAVLRLVEANTLRLPFQLAIGMPVSRIAATQVVQKGEALKAAVRQIYSETGATDIEIAEAINERLDAAQSESPLLREIAELIRQAYQGASKLFAFLIDRLKVQQREAGVRHDLIDAVFAAKNQTDAGEDDLVRLLARVKALQAFVGTAEGADLLAGYKRAANILKKSPSPPAGEGPSRAARVGEGAASDATSAPADPSPSAPDGAPPSPAGGEGLEESALTTALDTAEPLAAAAIDAEDFAAAMTALATLRTPIDAFFENVIVNDPDADKRAARLALLARFRDAVHRVADFSKIEG